MTSSVGHVCQTLSLDVVEVFLDGHTMNAVFVHLVEVRNEPLARYGYCFLEYGDLLLARVRILGGM